MATPAELTDAYRVAQATVAGRAAGALTIAYNTLLDPSALDRTFPRYLTVASQIVDVARREASMVGGAYYLAHREAMGIAGALDVAYVGSLPAEQVAASLLVTGPVTVKKALIRGATLDTAMSLGLAATVAAGYRHAADGGRDTIGYTADRDPQCIGYQRVTDGRPCYRCAMYASRGPVYKSRETALYRKGGKGRYHEKCGCSVEAVYDRDQPWHGRAREFEQMWKDYAKGSGNDAVNAFRRTYERPHLHT